METVVSKSNMNAAQKLNEIFNCEFRGIERRILSDNGISLIMKCRGTYINPGVCLTCMA